MVVGELRNLGSVRVLDSLFLGDEFIAEVLKISNSLNRTWNLSCRTKWLRWSTRPSIWWSTGSTSASATSPSTGTRDTTYLCLISASRRTPFRMCSISLRRQKEKWKLSCLSAIRTMLALSESRFCLSWRSKERIVGFSGACAWPNNSFWPKLATCNLSYSLGPCCRK